MADTLSPLFPTRSQTCKGRSVDDADTLDILALSEFVREAENCVSFDTVDILALSELVREAKIVLTLRQQILILDLSEFVLGKKIAYIRYFSFVRICQGSGKLRKS